jgi:gliding motility-associated-like protein
LAGLFLKEPVYQLSLTLLIERMKFAFLTLPATWLLGLFTTLSSEKQDTLLSVFIGNDTTINCNKLLDINAIVSPDNAVVTYNWKLVSAPSSGAYTATNPDKKTFGVNFSVAGTYVFSITVTETATGSEARDEITINVNCGGINPPPPSGTPLPKYSRMFSPNNDGINDVWKLEGISTYRNAVIHIYNQHGQLIFSTNSPTNDLIWDGKVKGNPMPVDTYYFVVLKDGKKILSDNIALLR